MLLALFSLATASAADTWAIDPVHSRVGFSVTHMTISSVEGRFKDFEGTISYDAGKLDSLKANVKIDMTSVDTENADRDAHLKKEDFLYVEKYPEMTFVSTGVKPGKKGAFELMGDLTIRGVTKPVTFEAKGLDQTVTDPWGNDRVGAHATTVIDRKAFGVNYNQVLDRGGVMVGDDVTIELDIEFVRQK